MKYDVIIVGAGPGGVFAAYELMQLNSNLKVGVFESGHSLEKRRCPIDGKKITIDFKNYYTRAYISYPQVDLKERIKRLNKIRDAR